MSHSRLGGAGCSGIMGCAGPMAFDSSFDPRTAGATTAKRQVIISVSLISMSIKKISCLLEIRGLELENQDTLGNCQIAGGDTTLYDGCFVVFGWLA